MNHSIVSVSYFKLNNKPKNEQLKHLKVKTRFSEISALSKTQLKLGFFGSNQFNLMVSTA